MIAIHGAVAKAKIALQMMAHSHGGATMRIKDYIAPFSQRTDEWRFEQIGLVLSRREAR